ncbi:ras-related and estrogen-regulated growth inhibitor isoform X1 [Megalopta genalis]|uniref:ras-related and estrogen-regulated growth inhibitor isoform X1 n=1 Tax=Megalopta genalis TaxID=115081 RepID=UPI003FCF814B
MEPPRQESSDFEVMERFSPPAASLKKRISPPIAWNLGLSSPKEPKLFKVILLGLQGVGKTALAVRFATKRFIGEYDCSTERMYKVDNFLDASWELTDPPGFLPPPTEFKLRLADAIILVYSVSDRVSFDETNRLRFLVSHAKKTRKVPPVVVLIGNKSDLSYTPGERVVSTSEGRQRAEQIEAHSFHEISVRESVEQVIHYLTLNSRRTIVSISSTLSLSSSSCFRHYFSFNYRRLRTFLFTTPVKRALLETPGHKMAAAQEDPLSL